MGKAKTIGIGLVLVVVIFFGIIFAIGMIAGTDSKIEEERLIKPDLSRAEIKAQSLDGISYDDLLRNNENHVEKTIHYTGEVLQTRNTFGDTYVLRIGVTEGTFTYSDVIWVNYVGPRILEGDIVEFWGVVTGIKEYEAVLGNVITIPEVDSLILDVVKKQGDS